MATTEDILSAAGVKQKPAVGMSADLQSRMAQADAEYQKRFGRPLPVTSTVRTREKQAELYANRGKYPVAAPGTSKHETGNAFDVDSSVPESFLNEFGLHRPIKNDPVHVELMPVQAPKTTIQEAKELGFTFAGPGGSILTDQPAAPVKSEGTSTESILQAASNVAAESTTPKVADTKAKWFGRKAASYADIVTGIPGQVGKLLTELGGYATARGLVPVEGVAAPGLTAEESQQAVTQAQGGTAEQAQAAREKAGAMIPQGLTAPIGTMTGTTETPEYQSTIPMELLGAVNTYGIEPTKNLLVKAGMSKADASALVDAATFALPAAVSKVSKLAPVKAATGAVSQATKTALSKVTPLVRSELRNAMNLSGKAAEPRMGEPAPAGATSVGAAETSKATELQQLLAQASPQLRQQLLERNIPLSEVNLEAVRNIVKADSLPDNSIKLSAGEAAQHSGMMSEEYNLRGGEKGEANRQRMDRNQQALINNMQLIRDEAAPDVHSTSMLDAGKNIIDEYKKLDEQKNKEINAASKELEDAAGASGYDLQVDPESIYTNIQKVLKTKGLRKTAEGMLEDLKQYVDEKSMTFEEYLNVRKNLSTIAGTAKDGNVRQAAHLAMTEMDKLPLKGETAQLKVLADKLRSTAKERFDQIKNDPAYADAIEDMAPVDFFNKHILGNKQPKNLQKIIDTFGEGSKVHQEMASGLMHYLSEKSGAAKNTFTQNQYNNALRNLDNKNVLPRIINPKSLNDLQNLGDVAALIDRKTASTYKNYAGTATALQAMAERAIAAGEEMGNIATMQHGIPIPGGTVVRKSVGAVKKVLKKTPEDIFYKKALQPGAGASLKDISQIGSK